MDCTNHEPGFTDHDLSIFGYVDDVFQHGAGAQLVSRNLCEQHPIEESLDENPFADAVDERKDSLEYEIDEKERPKEETGVVDRAGTGVTGDYPDKQPLLLGSRRLGELLEATMPGFHAILCGRATDGGFQGQASSISELPFLETTWKTITKAFHVHRSITRTILREVAIFSALRHTSKESGVLKISYTARMVAAIPDDLALSSTYIPSENATYSVLYGCNERQIQEVVNRAGSAGASINHPLLMMGIFVELDRKRLINMADSLADEFTLGSDILETSAWDPNNPKMQNYLKICLRSRTLVDYIRAVKRQLVKVLDEIDELERFWHSPKQLENEQRKQHMEGLTETGHQMKQRIRDIMDEYDDRIDECKKMAQNLSLAMQTGWNQIARQDSMTSTRISEVNTMIALETKRESAQMRSIAILTMIYLPLSSVASVFSTSLFNWNPGEGEPVVSKYIWVLLILALALTLLTVLAWHLWTNRGRGKDREWEKAGYAARLA